MWIHDEASFVVNRPYQCPVSTHAKTVLFHTIQIAIIAPYALANSRSMIVVFISHAISTRARLTLRRCVSTAWAWHYPKRQWLQPKVLKNKTNVYHRTHRNSFFDLLLRERERARARVSKWDNRRDENNINEDKLFYCIILKVHVNSIYSSTGERERERLRYLLRSTNSKTWREWNNRKKSFCFLFACLMSRGSRIAYTVSVSERTQPLNVRCVYRQTEINFDILLCVWFLINSTSKANGSRQRNHVLCVYERLSSRHWHCDVLVSFAILSTQLTDLTNFRNSLIFLNSAQLNEFCEMNKRHNSRNRNINDIEIGWNCPLVSRLYCYGIVCPFDIKSAKGNPWSTVENVTNIWNRR